jgi:S-adenosylmethionine-diacylglycerol 3-amino-3-carboxypropyl transferase
VIGAFADTLNYSSVNEDWRTEVEALALRPGNRVLCITGSGARPLALLAAEDVRVTAIDSVPAQNHLLRLTIAALGQLSVDEALGFIGLARRPARWRLAVLDHLRLAGSCRSYWSTHSRHVARGVLYQGRFERHFRQLGWLVRRLRGRAIRELLAFDDIEDQREFVRTTWDKWWWRWVYRASLDPRVSRLSFGDPAYFAHAAVPVGETVYRRMNESLGRFPAKDNFMVSLLFDGRLSSSDLPPHLRADGIARIRPRLKNLEIVDADLNTCLASGDGPRYDRFSLSDVPSFMSSDEYDRFMSRLVTAARPGARIVLRQFLTRYDVPAAVAGRLAREADLEARLAQEDRAFAYEFLIAEVKRGQAR